MSGSTFSVFIQDAFMRGKGIYYFENSRRATYAQQQYAIANPLKFAGYGKHCWGLTASEGPGPVTVEVGGIERTFFDYAGRGVPYGPDDGTLAPWAVSVAVFRARDRIADAQLQCSPGQIVTTQSVRLQSVL